MKLLVEGWRSLSQSFAVLNQWQLLALTRRPGIDVRIKDLPYFNPAWQAQQGLFPAEIEQTIRDLPLAEPDFIPDGTWSLGFPYDFRPAETGKRLIFGTTEYRVVPDGYIGPTSDLPRVLADPLVTISTSSRWSAEGFRRLGFSDDRVAVIPLGIEPSLFRPHPVERQAMRDALGLSGFVFMSAGAMTPNKGIDVLLRAFVTVAERHADVKLLLKGSDQLYMSQQYTQDALQSFSRAQISLLEQRIVYCGQALSMPQMSAAYQAADAYVSAYRAEGFNMPVLEAAACGTPVICTRGGSTDDFVTDEFALRIDSQSYPVSIDGREGEALQPSLDHLIALMDGIVDDAAFRAAAAVAGPAHATGHFTWDHTVARSLPYLLP